MAKFERYMVDLWTLFADGVKSKTIDNEPELIGVLAELYQDFGVPEDIPHDYTLVVKIDEKYLFINHVPVKIIKDFLENYSEEYRKIILFHDEILEQYTLIDGSGNIYEGRIERSISEILLPSNQGSFPLSTLSLILVSGLLDGINPCAFTVILFLITFLYLRGSIKWEDTARKKRMILLYGSAYITAVYLTYLAIGLTLREVIQFIPFPNLISKIAGLVVIAAGVIKIKDVYWPGRGISLKLSPSRWEKIRNSMRRVSLPATFLVGALVALFEFPCTGGIYIAILSTLATRTTFYAGLTYLLIYNVAFVLPLIAILVLASRKEVIDFSLSQWQENRGKYLGLLEGIVYIGLGFIIAISVF